MTILRSKFLKSSSGVRPEAVSYTHLDVYKRQILRFINFFEELGYLKLSSLAQIRDLKYLRCNILSGLDGDVEK